MKFSEAWLREWVDPDLPTEQLVERLTMAGLEVEGVEPVAGTFDDVVVAEVLEVEPHPDADKLRVCRVRGGDDVVQVVCGAPNVRVGLKTALAQVGANLGEGLVIGKAKLRGVESRGMLCSAAELGLSEEHDGLLELPTDAPVGQSLRDFLGLRDCSIELNLTPNRADCLSIAGLAREVSVLADVPFAAPDLVAGEPAAVVPESDRTLPIRVQATAACPRYIGRVIENVDVGAASPLWMREKLRRAGQRSIDVIVDITNYVMLELGQPLHAFDLDRLAGGINVRLAGADESIKLLDGKTHALTEGTLLIADDSGPVAIAGVMGGAGSAVTQDTRNVLLESAFFAPQAMAGRARSYGMHTDASHRFERGVDPALQVRAIERASTLLMQIAGGAAGPLVEVCDESALPQRGGILLRGSRIRRLLGIEVAAQRVEQALDRMGFAWQRSGDAEWSVVAPSHRFDIAIEADLIEEVARIVGYNTLPTTVPKSSLRMAANAETDAPLSRLRRQLTARGYQEAITYSFVEERLEQLLDPQQVPLALANPLSADLSVMRTSVWPGLVKTLVHNLNRQQQRVRLFETGLVFAAAPNRPLTLDSIMQSKRLAGLAAGPKLEEGWANDAAPLDFFDVKGDLEALLEVAGAASDFRFAPAEHPALHPGQCAHILRGERQVGLLGRLHPQVQRTLDIEVPVYLFDMDLDVLLSGRLPHFRELSRYPGVRRDIAVLVPRDVSAAAVQACVHDAAGEQLVNLRLFDVYAGSGIDPARKSLALGLTLQDPSRTLADDEIGSVMERVIGALGEQLGATLRQ